MCVLACLSVVNGGVPLKTDQKLVQAVGKISQDRMMYNEFPVNSHLVVFHGSIGIGLSHVA